MRRVGKHIVFDLERPKSHVSKTAKPFDKLRAGYGTSGGVAKSKSSGAPGLAGSETRARAQWIVHLGMTGQLLIGPSEAPMLKHTHAIVKLASGRELRFVDYRRFGRLAVVATGG